MGKAKSDYPIDEVMSTIRRAAQEWRSPWVTELASDGATPYQILIATILSLRTRDRPTELASLQLFEHGKTPEEIANLELETIAKAIAPVMYSRTKAQTIRDLSARLVNEFDSRVPDDIEELMQFKGVGRKTANLTVTLGYKKPGICVDVHVHRITNRWGFIVSRNPDETELILRESLPKKWWIPINDLLIRFGQNICLPVSPRCSICPVYEHCERRGVTTSR